MIHLEKGQKLFDNEGMVMYDQTGYYNDDDSIICAMVYAPEEPVCRYEAKFVAYGNNVYNITDPEKLLEEIKKIDPETLFGKNKEVIATQQMVENIQTTASEDLLSDTSANIPETDNPSDNTTPTEPLITPDPAPIEVPSATSTNATTSATNNSSTSTTATIPEITISPDTTTSTPSTISSTTTPDIVSGTSTEPIVETVVPAIENVINQLNNISDIVESSTSTSANSINLTI